MYKKYRMGIFLQYITIFYMRNTKYRNSSSFLFKRLPQCGHLWILFFPGAHFCQPFFFFQKKFILKRIDEGSLSSKYYLQ